MSVQQTFSIHPDDLCRHLDQQQAIMTTLERIADQVTTTEETAVSAELILEVVIDLVHHNLLRVPDGVTEQRLREWIELSPYRQPKESQR